jgi:hypothetical protein
MFEVHIESDRIAKDSSNVSKTVSVVISWTPYSVL